MPPLDPSIILGVKAPEIPDPQEFQNKSLTLQNLMQQREAGQLALEKTRQGVRDDAAAREAFKAGGTESEIYNRLLAVDPTRAQAYLKFNQESRGREAQTAQHTATAAKANWEVEKENAERGANLLSNANGQNWEQIVRLGLMNKHWSQAAADFMLQQGYSPELVKQLQAKGIAYAKQQELEGQAQGRAETGRHNIATEGQTQATAPFTMGPGGPVPNVAAQEYERSKQPGGQPHYDTERGIVVDPKTGVGTPVVVGGQPVGAKPNAATQKELMTIGQQESTVDGALAAVKKTPSAFGFSRGAATMAGPAAETLRGRLDSKEESEARSYVFNIVSKVINERAGAAQSAQELARLRSFLPGEMDNATQITNKLNGFKTYLADMRKGTTPAAPASPGGAPGGAPSMRVSPEQQNARDNEAGAIRAAQQPPDKIASDIASLETALRNPRLDGTQRGILERELNLQRRAREIQGGGGAPTVAAAPGGGAPGGRTVKRTGTLNGRKVVEFADGTVEYTQ